MSKLPKRQRESTQFQGQASTNSPPPPVRGLEVTLGPVSAVSAGASLMSPLWCAGVAICFATSTASICTLLGADAPCAPAMKLATQDKYTTENLQEQAMSLPYHLALGRRWHLTLRELGWGHPLRLLCSHVMMNLSLTKPSSASSRVGGNLPEIDEDAAAGLT